ncbi:MAG: DnaA N-terminal domain-containing protein, partial [Methylotenera sp.]
MENFWPACLSRFENELSAQQFNTWIKPLQAEIDGEAVRISAPNRFVMQWVKDRFLKKIESFAEELNLPGMKIEFVLGETTDKKNNSDAVAPKKVNKDIDLQDEEALKINLAKVITSNNKPVKTAINKNEDSGLNPSFN